MFKSLNDTSKYFFPLEDLLLSTERMTKVLKKPQTTPNLSPVLLWDLLPFFPCSPLPRKSGDLCGTGIQAAVSLQFCTQVTFKVIYYCFFFVYLFGDFAWVKISIF